MKPLTSWPCCMTVDSSSYKSTGHGFESCPTITVRRGIVSTSHFILSGDVGSIAVEHTPRLTNILPPRVRIPLGTVFFSFSIFVAHLFKNLMPNCAAWSETSPYVHSIQLKNRTIVLLPKAIGSDS